jgi:hypothetical protein
MLCFCLNRAGRQLPSGQRLRLERAKDELRALFDRPRAAGGSNGRRAGQDGQAEDI